MWRILALGFLLFRTVSASFAAEEGSNALILIQPLRAGPFVDIHTYVHPEWVKWPQSGKTGDNRLLSLITGENWVGGEQDFLFKQNGPNAWRSVGYADLVKRGHFTARKDYLFPGTLRLVSDSAGSTTFDTLLIALDFPGDEVHSLRNVTNLGPLITFVASATSWDDAVRVSREAGGRTLVVEYPPPASQGWSRLWRLGKGWPVGQWIDPQVSIPGLTTADRAYSLLKSPKAFHWHPDDSARWGGANRWLEFRQQSGAAFLSLLLLSILAVGVWSAVLVSKESSNPFAIRAVELCLLSPCILVICGAISAWTDLILFPVLIPPVATIILWLIGFAVKRILPKEILEPRMVAIGLVTAASLGIIGCTWSLFNRNLEVDIPAISAIGAGSFFAALHVIISLSNSSKWVARVGMGVVLALTFSRIGWWSEGPSVILILPLLTWVSGEGWLRLPLATASFLYPPVVINLMQHGWAWKPAGLLSTLIDRDAVDSSIYVLVLLDPLLIGLVLVSTGLALFADPFLGRELRRAVRSSAHVGRFFWLCATVAVMGFLTPSLLMVSFVMLTCCCLLGLHFLLSTNG